MNIPVEDCTCEEEEEEEWRDPCRGWDWQFTLIIKLKRLIIKLSFFENCQGKGLEFCIGDSPEGNDGEFVKFQDVVTLYLKRMSMPLG